MSEIDPSTIRAYLETDYCVTAPEPFALHVGIASAPLAELYARHAAGCCAFITACNPYSHLADDRTNAERQAELARELKQRGLTFFDGAGRDPAGEWPAEASFLVLGVSRDDAKALGNAYRQNAIVWCGSDATPELILLR